MKINGIRIIKENRQYVDSPEDAPDDVQVHEGESPDTYYYISGDQEENEQQSNLEELEARFDQGEFTFGEYDQIIQGDRVEILNNDGELIQGTYIQSDGGMDGIYYEVQDDNGNTHYASSYIRVIDGVQAPGEEIDPSGLKQGDQITYLTSYGEVESTVISADEDTIRIRDSVTGNAREIKASGERYGRTENSTERSVTGYAESIEVEDAGRDFKERAMETITETVAGNCKDDNIGRNMLSHVEQVRNRSDKNAWNSEENTMQFKSDATDTTIAHEYAHALADSYGYETDREKGVNIFAQFGVVEFLPLNFGDGIKNNVINSLEHLEENTNFELSHAMRDTIDENYDNDVVIEKEDFMLTQEEDKDVPEKVENLINEVNNSWEHIRDKVEEEKYQSADLRTPLRPYVATNAHEMLAGVQQILQSSNGDEAHASTLYSYHPDLLKAYLEIYDPSDEAKEVLNDLHSDMQGEVFEDIPFPGIEGDEE